MVLILLFFFDEDGSPFLFLTVYRQAINRSGTDTILIRMFEFDALNKRIKGKKLLINGGTDTAKHRYGSKAPISIKDGWYYLMCAEGGTGYNHSEVVFRSRSVYGPLNRIKIQYLHKDILIRQEKSCYYNRPCRPGEGKDGKWWAFFLAAARMKATTIIPAGKPLWPHNGMEWRMARLQPGRWWGGKYSYPSMQ